jgi:hypothetical protein
MLRRSFTIASILSLLLCVATASLWARSYWVCDGFLLARDGNLSYGRCVRGHLTILRVYGIARENAFARVHWTNLVDYDQATFTAPGAWIGGRDFPGAHFHCLGIAVVGGTQEYIVSKNPWAFQDYSSRLIVIPYWLPCLITAWPLLVLMVHGLKRIPFRHPAGTCRRCGYDLRASEERCPECGTAIAPRISGSTESARL